MHRTMVVGCLLAVALGGCKSGDTTANSNRTIEPRYTASSPSPRATAASSDGCQLLTSRERGSIAGEKLDVVTPVQVSKGTLQCRWVRSPSSSVVSLTVESLPAKTWAQSFPQKADAATLSGQVDDKLMKRLRDAKNKVAERREELSGSEACDMFSLLLQANTGLKRASVHVHTQPTETGEVNSAIAQKCTMGVYTAVTYSEPQLQQSYPLGQAMRRLIKIAHERAIKVL